jgi:hypothetical protein
LTAGTLIQKVWEELGEPSDLNPATVGVPKLLDAVNDAQDVVAQWIDNRGRKCFFREMECEVRFSTLVETGTFTEEASGVAITLPVTVTPVLGRFVRWVLTTGGETRDVVASGVTGGRNVLTVASAFSNLLLDGIFVLAKREYQLTGLDALDTGGQRLVEIQRIFDAETGTRLEEAASADQMMIVSSGTPGTWRHRGSGIVLDAAPPAARMYIVHAVRLPTRVTEQTDIIELPDAFCQALHMHVVKWGYRRMQDFQAAYATKKEFEELMTRLATASWMSNEPDYFTVRSR